MLNLRFPAVMGVLNVTPDSFSDGGRFFDAGAACDHARRMIDEGVDIIDIGGESTRPGADAVSAAEEMRRVLPVIAAIRAFSDIPISIDTSKPEVMTRGAQAGANMINDVRALRGEGALEAAAETGLPICLMHMQGDPKTMQTRPEYDDVIGEIRAFFRERMERCEAAGISKDRILLDPGFGFGKTPRHNLMLINRLGEFVPLGRPLLVGLSRKSTIAKILGDEGADRLFGSIGGAVTAVARGAAIVRVHDVAPTVDAVRVAAAIMNEEMP